MAKQFIKVTKDYATKNKVQELCLKELKKLDQTLWSNYEDAIHIICDVFENALSQYQGKAKIPELKQFRPDKNSYQYYIDEVINLTIYEVKGEKIPV